MTYFLSLRKWIDKEFYYSERVRRTRFDADNLKDARKTAVSVGITIAIGFESKDLKDDLIHTIKRGKWVDGLHPDAEYKFSRRDSDYFFELKPTYDEGD